MSLTQQSRSIAELVELGWSRDKIAAELGVSTMFIFRSLKMMAEVQRKPVETPSQLSMMAITVEELYAKEAKEWQKRKPDSVLVPVPEQKGEAREKAAKALGVGSVQSAKTGPGWKKPAHLPTLEEIAAACEAIQATWSERGKRSRAPMASRWTLQHLCWSDLAG
jgi:hypothetical protein